MAGFPSPTLYDLLQVRSDATSQDVRNAWRRLAQEHHPDRGEPLDADAMTRINQAYAVLSDPDRRARYDQQLLAARQPRRRGWRGLLRRRGIAAGAGAVLLAAVAAGVWTVMRPQQGAPAARVTVPQGPASAPEEPLRLTPSHSIDSWSLPRAAEQAQAQPAVRRASP